MFERASLFVDTLADERKRVRLTAYLAAVRLENSRQLPRGAIFPKWEGSVSEMNTKPRPEDLALANEASLRYERQECSRIRIRESVKNLERR